TVIAHAPGSAAATESATAGRRRQRQQLRHALALVHAARFSGDLVVGAAEHGIELRAASEIQDGRRFGAGGLADTGITTGTTEAGGVIKLLRLPRTQAVRDLLGESIRIRGSAERFRTQPRRGLV